MVSMEVLRMLEMRVALVMAVWLLMRALMREGSWVAR